MSSGKVSDSRIASGKQVSVPAWLPRPLGTTTERPDCCLPRSHRLDGASVRPTPGTGAPNSSVRNKSLVMNRGACFVHEREHQSPDWCYSDEELVELRRASVATRGRP